MPQAIRLHEQPPREKKEVRIKLAERALAHQRCSVCIAVLEQLLATLMLKQMAVLPNYPNPFNPDTRIPYQLAMPAEVEISIYAADGTLVRTLVLGQFWRACMPANLVQRIGMGGMPTVNLSRAVSISRR